MFIYAFGTPGGAREIQVPARSNAVNKLFFVRNDSNGAVTVKVSGQTGVVVPVNTSMALKMNDGGTDVVEAITHVASLTLGAALPATSGGTGQSSYTIGDLLYASSTTALTKLTVGANGAVLTVAAGIPAWTPTLGVSSGGTGAATLAANNVLLGNGTSALQVVAPGTSGNVLTSAGGTWTSAALPASYVGPNADVKTTGTGASFTIPPGITQLKVTVVGGGGGSGGSEPGNTGGAGGGGGVAIVWLSGLTPGGTITYSVGSGGTAGVASPVGNGGPGGNSSITSGVTTVTANGGGGGQAGGANGTGGSASNGNLNITGSSASAGGSGSNMFSEPVLQASGSATAGTGYGGGAGAGVASISNIAGAAGSGGVIIFEW
jgi:hypothetical protein